MLVTSHYAPHHPTSAARGQEQRRPLIHVFFYNSRADGDAAAAARTRSVMWRSGLLMNECERGCSCLSPLQSSGGSPGERPSARISRVCTIRRDEGG